MPRRQMPRFTETGHWYCRPEIPIQSRLLRRPRPALLVAFLVARYWTAISCLALPPSKDVLWALFSIYWLSTIGTMMEGEWGAFRYFAYWLLNIVAAIVAASIAQTAPDNALLLMTLVLAFATLWPDYPIRL